MPRTVWSFDFTKHYKYKGSNRCSVGFGGDARNQDEIWYDWANWLRTTERTIQSGYILVVVGWYCGWKKSFTTKRMVETFETLWIWDKTPITWWFGFCWPIHSIWQFLLVLHAPKAVVCSTIHHFSGRLQDLEKLTGWMTHSGPSWFHILDETEPVSFLSF